MSTLRHSVIVSVTDLDQDYFWLYYVDFWFYSRQPEVLWAQRSDKIYLTVSLPDARDVSVQSQPQGVFQFSAVGAQGELFDFSLELYDTVVPEVRFLSFFLYKWKKCIHFLVVNSYLVNLALFLKD